MRRGEIYFDLSEDSHPTYGQSKYVLKRWKKHTIYFKSGSYIRANYVKSGSYGSYPYEFTNYPMSGSTYLRQSNNLNQNLYATHSIYLYDYVVVTDDFFHSLVYTSSIDDTTPSFTADIVGTNFWTHREDTFRDSPNAETNNFLLSYDTTGSIAYARDIYGAPIIFRDQGEYFEIVGGYPRNHFTHKRDLFSLYRLTTFNRELDTVTSGSYKRCSQNITTTVGEDGLENGSSPIQATTVGNLNLIQSDNVINQ